MEGIALEADIQMRTDYSGYSKGSKEKSKYFTAHTVVDDIGIECHLVLGLGQPAQHQHHMLYLPLTGQFSVQLYCKH